ncbi:MAG: hypothetical protein MSG64_15250 [Pyrinomonadaceae bacterium MAG19_C2-C3]|nr:hypothetical protein [Pyrinomonadaceae bacterium MAG19_C2-C3]
MANKTNNKFNRSYLKMVSLCGTLRPPSAELCVKKSLDAKVPQNDTTESRRVFDQSKAVVETACKLMMTILMMTYAVASNVAAQTYPQETTDTQETSTQVIVASPRQYVLELAAPNPVLRLRAAENLARVAAVDERRIVEGYRLQEKDKRVQLALDWALYRFGDETKLFRIVSALDSTAFRSQSIAYLSQLDAPEPLYMFLGSPKRNVRIGILDALGNIGNAGTFPQVAPLTQASDKRTAEAANAATKRITERLETETRDSQNPTQTRPRQTGNRRDDDDEPPMR